jgi:iron complex transport system ATP-binding protein
MPGRELLRLEGVTAGYGNRTAVRNVDLSVNAGEVVGLVGPNGSGKTTLVRVASRTLRPWSGRVRVDGQDPYSIPARHAARSVAVVPQEFAPVFSFTVLEVILMGRSPYLSPWGGGGELDYRRAREAAESVRVQHLADRPVEELSGGEKQRVVLAQALAQDAPVLLLDEPTTHLDLRHVVGILDIVRSLAVSEEKAVLGIFHDLNLASGYCDRLVAIDSGEVVAEGRPESVVTRRFIRDVYDVEGEVVPHFATGRPTVLLGPPLEPARPGAPVRAHVVGGAGRGAPVMRALAELGYEVTAGALHATDTDATVAERLNLARVTVPPFSVVDEEARREVVGMMRRASLVVMCDAPFGPGNVGNIHAALEAVRAGARVVVIDEVPMRERDFTGGEAASLWNELIRAGERIGSYEELVAALPRASGS